MPRFVILAHDWPEPHWDFLAEAGGVLRAWRLRRGPLTDTDVPADLSFDHRLLYLDYEGPISSGRGSVTRWDSGTCEWLSHEPDRVELDVRGEELVGRVVICRAGDAWVFRLTASAG